eukprot:scaffold112979_cov36-Prasinocladus_malaysianus.AAC.1
MRYVDVEEVWVEDDEGNGHWQPVTSGRGGHKSGSRKPPTGKRAYTKRATNKELMADDVEEI